MAGLGESCTHSPALILFYLEATARIQGTTTTCTKNSSNVPDDDAPSTETLQCITDTGLLIDYGQLAHSTNHDTLIIVIH